jgi:DNA-binding XRE family transcriptional regulator
MSNRPRLVVPAVLKAMRARAGWSQVDLAERAEVHVQTVKYWERQSFILGYAPDRFWAAFEDAVAAVETPQVTRKASDRCGARTRRGTPCAAKAIPGKHRCKHHGGMSTGPRSQQGRERIAAAQRKRWLKWQILRQVEHRRRLRSDSGEALSL